MLKVTKISRLAPVAALALLGMAGCSDFLTSGETQTDPNRPVTASNNLLFTGIQSNIWSELMSDPARITGVWAGQFNGFQGQYFTVNNYGVSEQTTGGFHSALYAGGGLVDIRKLQAGAKAASDTIMLGVAEVQEAILISTGADLFGDLVYSHALTGEANPPLDKQLDVYDALTETVLVDALKNLSVAKKGTNVGPGAADLAFGGSPAKWIKLAHTVRARIYMHEGEVRPTTAYAKALAEARLGMTTNADDFIAPFAGSSLGEANFFFQFDQVNRFGYLAPNPSFVDTLKNRNDPRLNDYVSDDPSLCGNTFCLSEARDAPDFTQPLITANQNLLVWAEAAFRVGNIAEAQAEYNAERDLAGATPNGNGLVGNALLTAILGEKYVVNFETIEAFNDYKRTCYPNVTPNVAGVKIPARLLYDTGERQTNTSIPSAQDQPTRNQNDPPNAVSDGLGTACLGQ
jgi:starch-binding outer membrane protein, SusD/RagB family